MTDARPHPPKAPTAAEFSALDFVVAPMRERLSAFVATLRANGFAVGLAESHDALRVLGAPDMTGRDGLRVALRALFASRRADWDKFDAIFDAFWLAKATRGETRASDERRKPPTRPPGAGETEAGGAGGEAGAAQGAMDEAADRRESDRRSRASARESFMRTDFRHMLDREQLQRAFLLASRLAAKMRTRLTRRQRIARRGRRLDLRRTIHRSIGRGGTPVELMFRKRRVRPLKLVILLDASGSMIAYTPVFVCFMHGAVESFKRAEGFVFHTRLVCVTEAIREKNPQRAIERLGLLAEGVGGGTRIGACLATFNAHHAARAIDAKTVTMIVSDGFETGDAEGLGEAMRDLRKRCKRIVWLNPLLGWRGYEPLSAGMTAALPYVDVFAPAHSLESLEALEPILACM
ncbi:VWA domain-containing protein [uncultured Rhodoblastus sp.]|uniref:vWA domain-containing protein n=1 Tax=uncultured Rhodoblastus sp. TaxID=543037 RepID=UPI0025EB5E9F|nr:VWA domain-containing protein [uncultured Rhodoblastus sp.]